MLGALEGQSAGLNAHRKGDFRRAMVSFLFPFSPSRPPVASRKFLFGPPVDFPCCLPYIENEHLTPSDLSGSHW